MSSSGPLDRGAIRTRRFSPPDGFLLALSLALQVAVGLLLGHVYDMRIFMATGYLVGTGQNPYVAQDLSAVFHNPTFQGITSVGYPPPWPLALGLIYLLTYKNLANLLLYNLSIKIPIIVANVCLAYVVARLLRKLGAAETAARGAWVFLLFNPLLLYATSAWGQFDSIVALLSLLALVDLGEDRLTRSAILLALAIAFKPTALPLLPAAFVYLRGGPVRLAIRYFAIFAFCSIGLFAGPFALLGWDPTPILKNWNFHFSVAGGLSFMTFLELIRYPSTVLPGSWWLVGLLWLPALGIVTILQKPSGEGLLSLLKISTALSLVFFLTSTWLSEPNVVLVLPPVLILAALGKLERRALTALWVVPLFFAFFNVSMFQLLFPVLPGLMDRLLHLSDLYHTPRLIMRTLAVMPWLLTAAWIISKCSTENRIAATETLPA